MQDKYIFDLVHLTQKEGWQLEGAAIIIYTNFFSVQQEYIGMISPNKRITVTTQARRLDIKDLTGGIRNKKGY